MVLGIDKAGGARCPALDVGEARRTPEVILSTLGARRTEGGNALKREGRSICLGALVSEDHSCNEW
jgi:hypothetical protein